MTAALDHAQALIRLPSVTPEDGGCQDWLEEKLAPLGFRRQRVDMGGVTNSIFARPGERPGTLAFLGHTDVVPPGPAASWPHPPFAGVIEDDVLHGRGAQDMKGGIACWLAAIEEAVADGAPLPDLQVLITSDEEGESVDGAVRIVEALAAEGRLPDAAIVGEPSSSKAVGDVIRRGRRGVVQVVATIRGRQGHSAYPDDAVNAAHLAIPALHRALEIDWGEPAPGFPPTTCQITNIEAGTGAMNVIPGSCRVTLDIRFNPALDFDGVETRLREAFAELPDAAVELDIQRQANAFVTPDGPFLDFVAAAIERRTGLVTRRDTGGGTSDARFLAARGVPVAELGLTNDTIHQVGERVRVAELGTLTGIYKDIIQGFEARP